MTKMRTKVMLTVMAAMSMVAACGMDVTPTKPDTTVAAETVETVTDLAHKVNEVVAATEVMTTEETTVEETTAEETTAEETTEVETAAAEESTEETTAETTKAKTKAETKAAPKAETKAAPKAETKAETKAAPKAEAPKAPAPTQAAPAPTQAPAHTHQWKEHKATREEWVPNIVNVPDYETREEVKGYFICNCGAEFRIDDSDFAMHNMTHMINGEPDNYSTEVRVIGSEEVQVGSHEEDHGHSETVEYTDYMYCDCGATK